MDAAESAAGIDSREVPRAPCRRPTFLWVAVRPSFAPFRARVQDVSVKGVGLVGDRPAPVGAELAIQWHVGPPDQWATVRARVVWCAHSREGTVRLGCEFDPRLPVAAVQALFSDPPPDEPA